MKAWETDSFRELLRLAKTVLGKTYQQLVVHKVVVFRERFVDN